MTDYRFLSDTLFLFCKDGDQPVLSALRAFTHAPSVSTYIDLFRALVHDNPDADLTTAIERTVCCDDNVYTRACAGKSGIASHIADAAERDIRAMASMGGLSAAAAKKMLDPSGTNADVAALPEYRTHATNLSPETVREYCARHGVGIFSRAKGFVYASGIGLTPVKTLDPIRLSDLKGYECQRREVVDNTEAFLNGYPAQNVLLYGDRGTGKSSTVKAILNEYGDRGLRVIELDKACITDLDRLMTEIQPFPMKFIVFIDDLSFNENDRDYGLLKAALEGSLVARPDNIVVYATSNRRHLLKETFSAREGNEVHRADTLDESLSLSDRFGLTVTFMRPARDEYLEIVRRLASDFGIETNDELDLGAEQWALLAGGRSPRVAKQYLFDLMSKRGLRRS